MDILNERNIRTLRYLLDHTGYATSNDIAAEIQVSVRTMKTILRNLGDEVTMYGCVLEVKRGVGYRLQITDEEAFQPLRASLQDIHVDKLPTTKKERENYIIRKLLSVDYPIRLDDLADELYVSRNTISLDIREVRRIIKGYDMHIEQNANGIYIDGTEIRKRVCINDFFFQDTADKFYVQDNMMFSSTYNQSEIRYIREALLHVLNDHNIRFSDMSIQNMVVHIMIGIRRCRFYQYVQIDEELKTEVMNCDEYQAAYELKEKIEEQLHVVYPQDEIIYMAMHIISKSIARNPDVQLVTRQENMQLLQEICCSVRQVYDIDIEKDQELYQFLSLHIPAMVRRIRLQMTMRNPLYIEHLRHYPYAVEISLMASDIIERQMHVTVDENEFAYLVIYFNLALNRQHGRSKKRLILVSGYGRPEMILTLNALNESFKGFLDEIVTCDAFELGQFSFKEQDIVVTTVPIMTQLEVPMLYIQDSVEKYHNEILALLKSNTSSHVNYATYMPREFFAAQVSCKSRKDVHEYLRMMLQSKLSPAAAKRICTSIYELGNEVGNEVALLHTHAHSGMPFIAFLCLKNPIIWKRREVKYVFLLHVHSEKDMELKAGLYEAVASWCDHKAKIQHFEKSQTYADFLETMKNR